MVTNKALVSPYRRTSLSTKIHTKLYFHMPNHLIYHQDPTLVFMVHLIYDIEKLHSESI